MKTEQNLLRTHFTLIPLTLKKGEANCVGTAAEKKFILPVLILQTRPDFTIIQLCM